MTKIKIESLLKKYYPEAFSEKDTLGFRLLQFGVELYNQALNDAEKNVSRSPVNYDRKINSLRIK
jgi:hypothetical protein